jgi:hypothetical protein
MGSTTFSGPVTSTAGFIGDHTGPAVTTTAGAGITAGTGTVISTEVTKIGKTVLTHIYIDVTGLTSSATNGDIIGVEGVGAAYLAAIANSESGQVYEGTMTCLEAPATGDPDIDMYAADEATGVEDTAIGDLTETALVASAASWTLGRTVALTAWPTDGQYLYLSVGNTGVGATYTAGIFLIELWGYEA